MKFFILMLIFGQQAVAQTCGEFTLGTPRPRGIEALSTTTTKSCDGVEISQDRKTASQFDLGAYLNTPKDQLCSCLESAKFNELRVDWKRKRDFKQFEYDRALRIKLKHSLTDLIGNFSKFSNLIATKTHLGNLMDQDRINAAGGFCDLKSLTQDITALTQSADCRAPKGFMAARLKAIFGTDDTSKLLSGLERMSNDVDDKSCISHQQYLDLRSSSGASSRGFKLLNDTDSVDFKTAFNSPTTEDRGPLKELMTYDIFFNIAYRDANYREELKGIMTAAKERGERQYDIYRNPEALKATYAALNGACNRLSNSMKQFLCAGEYPRMHPATLNLHLDDYFASDRQETPIARNSMRDYFTWDYSCNPERNSRRTGSMLALYTGRGRAAELTEAEKGLNSTIEESVLIKNITKNVFDKSERSDYTQFNEMFCRGREGKKLTPEELPLVLSQYLKSQDSSKKAALENALKKLGLKLGGDPLRIDFLDPSKIAEGRMPTVNLFRWNELAREDLLRAGMSPGEIDQIYALVEMQTNRQFSDIEDLKMKLAGDNEVFSKLTHRDVYGLMIKDPAVIASVNERMRSDPNYRIAGTTLPPDQMGPVRPQPPAEVLTGQIMQRYSATRADQEIRANDAQAVLFSEKPITEVRAAAQVYNNNQGTLNPSLMPSTSSSVSRSLASEGSSFIPTPTTELSNLAAVKPPSVGTEQTSVSSVTERSSETTTTRSSSDSNTSALPIAPTILPDTSISPAIPSIVDQEERSSTPSKRPTKHDHHVSKTERENYDPAQDEYIEELRRQVRDARNQVNDAVASLNNEQGFFNSRGAANKANKTQKSSRQDDDYDYPDNVPFSDGNGGYYYPGSSGELNSKNKSEFTPEKEFQVARENGISPAADSTERPTEDKNQKATNSQKNAQTAKELADASAGIGSIGNGLAGKRAPGSFVEAEADARKRLKLEIFEYPRIIPHALVDVLGGVDKVVILLSLEGRRFKTIEAVEIETTEDEKKVRYQMRIYDFIPEGEFEDLKEEFSSKEARSEAFNRYFRFERTKDNLIISKKYAQATKEIEKQELDHNAVLKIQNDIMSDVEIKKIVDKMMDRIQ